MSLKFPHAAPFLPIKALPITPCQKQTLLWSPPDYSTGTNFLFYGLSHYAALLPRYLPHSSIVCSLFTMTTSFLSYIFDKHSLSIYNMGAQSWTWGGGGQRYRNKRQDVCSGNAQGLLGTIEVASPTVFNSVPPAVSKVSCVYQIQC